MSTNNLLSAGETNMSSLVLSSASSPSSSSILVAITSSSRVSSKASTSSTLVALSWSTGLSGSAFAAVYRKESVLLLYFYKLHLVCISLINYLPAMPAKNKHKAKITALFLTIVPTNFWFGLVGLESDGSYSSNWLLMSFMIKNPLYRVIFRTYVQFLQ